MYKESCIRYNLIMIGGGKCSICYSPGTTKRTCPMNQHATNPNPAKHPLARQAGQAPMPTTAAGRWVPCSTARGIKKRCRKHIEGRAGCKYIHKKNIRTENVLNWGCYKKVGSAAAAAGSGSAAAGTGSAAAGTGSAAAGAAGSGTKRYVDVPYNRDTAWDIGVFTVPVFNTSLLGGIRTEIDRMINRAPLLKHTPDAEELPPQLGGFAALAIPSSFHDPLARSLRKHYKKALLPAFRVIAKKNKLKNLEILYDRFMLRRPGQKPSKESWHRDITMITKKPIVYDVPQGKFALLKNAKARKNLLKSTSDVIGRNDIILGGWINLDDQDQFFSCVLKSHHNTSIARLSHELSSRKNKSGGFSGCDSATVTNAKTNSVFVRVPPGHAIQFPQYIVHEVLNKSNKRNTYRIFTGARLTNTFKPLIPDLKKLIIDQGVPLMSSGLICPVYSLNHASFFKTKKMCLYHKTGNNNTKEKVCVDGLMDWSKRKIIDVVLGSNGICPRHLPSIGHVERLTGKTLRSRPYSNEEMRIMGPHPLF